jgi:hypothetical protein
MVSEIAYRAFPRLKMPSPLAVSAIGLFWLLLTAGGCGGAKLPARQPVVPVRGEVLFEGKPAIGAVVSFIAANGASSAGWRANGRVGEDGAFALTTYVTNDGAPPGEYVVTVYWAAASRQMNDEDEETDLPPDRLNGRFATRERSVLRARVGSQPVEFAAIDLSAREIGATGTYFLREK